MKCGDCANVHQCRWLLRRTGEETECDWEPPRFVPKSAALLQIERRVAERQEKRA